MPPAFSIVSDEELLKAHADGAPFQIKVDGDEQAFFGKMKAAYEEWIYGRKQGAELTSYSVAYHTTAPLIVEADGKRASVAASRVRIFVAPSFEKEFKAGDTSAPEIVQEEIARAKAPIYAAEYRLEAGKTYWATVHPDSYLMPPAQPGQPPRKGTNSVLRISDKPFGKDGEPQVQATPTYRTWTY